MLAIRPTFIDRPSRASTLAPLRLQPARSSRIVALGGGTGLPTLLRGLKDLMFTAGSGCRRSEAERDRLTAIVTMADDGGSSGRLRSAYGVLPPGDLRNCLLALSDGESRLASLFGFRFRGNGGLGGHNLGNLILTALSEIDNDLLGAIEWASDVLDVCGRVMPASLEPLTLRADFADGSRMDGESRIAAVRGRIDQISICPGAALALPQALRAIEDADLIVIAPGSLYTSIMAVLLIREIAAAIERSGAPIVLVLNLMTEPGETDGYSAIDFVSAIRHHAPRLRISDVLINNVPIAENVLEQYAAEGAGAVMVDPDHLRFLGCAPVLCDLLGEGNKVRHDSRKLGRAVLELAAQEMRCAIPR